MGRRGRPRRERPAEIVNVKLYLDPVEDEDLVGWFGSLPAGCRAQAVIARLRSGTSLGGAVVEGLPSDEEVAEVLGGRLW